MGKRCGAMIDDQLGHGRVESRGRPNLGGRKDPKPGASVAGLNWRPKLSNQRPHRQPQREKYSAKSQKCGVQGTPVPSRLMKKLGGGEQATGKAWCALERREPQRFDRPRPASSAYKSRPAQGRRAPGALSVFFLNHTHPSSSLQTPFFPSRTPSSTLRSAMSSIQSTAPPPAAAAAAKKHEDEKPADLNIPDNYVSYTLRNQKPLPPVQWRNLHKELNYISFAVLTLTPTIALFGAFTTKLQWQTAVWSVIYYFITGLGTSFDTLRTARDTFFSDTNVVRHYCGVSPPLGAPLIQRVEAARVLPRRGWRRRRRGLHQVVVARPPRAPPLHGHGPRPVQRAQGPVLVAHRLDARQAPPQARRRGRVGPVEE